MTNDQLEGSVRNLDPLIQGLHGKYADWINTEGLDQIIDDILIFGSALRPGDFHEKSDIDTLCIIPDNVRTPFQRCVLFQRLHDAKASLEKELWSFVKRGDGNIADITPITSFELRKDIGYAKSPYAYGGKKFLSVQTGVLCEILHEPVLGILPPALAVRVVSIIGKIQEIRKLFVANDAHKKFRGIAVWKPESTEPLLPKKLASLAAEMTYVLENENNSENLQRSPDTMSDSGIGAQKVIGWIEELKTTDSPESEYVNELHQKIHRHAYKRHTQDYQLTPFDQAFLYEVIWQKAHDLALRRINAPKEGPPPVSGPDVPGAEVAHENGLEVDTKRRHDALRQEKFRYEISGLILSGFSEQRERERAVFPVTTRTSENSREKLHDLVHSPDSAKRHVILIGDGGMGKTTALWHLVEFFEKSGTRTPLYLELQEINAAFSDALSDNWILDALIRHYAAHPAARPSSDDRRRMANTLARASAGAGCVLLLDGLNEVSRNHAELVKALSELEKYENLTIIITSRYDLLETNPERYRQYRCRWLTGVEEADIESYLRDRQFPRPFSARLRDRGVLRNPMLLCLYARSYVKPDENAAIPVTFFPEPETKGEILHNFLCVIQVKWTESNLRVGEQWAQTESRILFDFVLPYLGQQMERLGLFEITAKEALGQIETALTFLHDASVLRQRNISPDHVERMMKHSPRGDLAYRMLTEVLTHRLVLLRARPGEHKEELLYSFVHQDFRDYFAARYLLARIAEFLERKEKTLEVAADLRERVLSVHLHRMIGSLEGEHRNGPQWGVAGLTDEHKRKTNLDALVDRLRGRSDEDIGFVLHNIVRVFIESEKDLSVYDFSNLDLGRVGLNGIRLGRGTKGASFKGVTLRDSVLFPGGHVAEVIWVGPGPTPETIGSASKDGMVRLWDRRRAESKQSFFAHQGGITAVAETPGWELLVTAGNDTLIRRWTWDTEKDTLTELDSKLADSSVNALLISRQADRIVSGADASICIWDATSGERLNKMKNHASPVLALALSEAENVFYSGDKSGAIKAWDLLTGDWRLDFPPLSKSTTALCAVGNGLLIAGMGDGTLAVLNRVTRDTPPLFFAAHFGRVTSLRPSIDEKRLISTARDGRIKEWNLELIREIVSQHSESDSVSRITEMSGPLMHSLNAGPAAANWAVFLDDGRSILAASDDYNVREWELTTGECIRMYRGFHSGVNSVAYAPNAAKFLLASEDGTIKEWDADTGRCLQVFTGHESGVNSAAYSPSGERIVSGSTDFSVREWDTKSGKMLHTYRGHRDIVYFVSYKRINIMSASYDGVITLWNIKRDGGQRSRERRGRIATVHLAAVSLESGRLLSAHDNRLCEWDSQAHTLLRVIPDYPGIFIQGADFSGADLTHLSAEQIWILDTYGAKLAETAREVAHKHGEGQLATDQYLFADAEKKLSSDESLEELHRELNAKYGRMIRDESLPADERRLTRIVASRHTVDADSECQIILEFVRKYIAENLRELAIWEYISMEKADSFGFFGEQRTAVSFCRILLEIPVTREVSQLDADVFRDVINKTDGKYKNPRAAYYLEKIRNFRLRLFDQEFGAKSLDRLDVLLVALGTPYRLYTREEGDNDEPSFIFGTVREVQMHGRSVELIEVEHMRSPHQVLATSGPAFGDTVIRRESEEVLFLNTWVSVFERSNFELELLLSHDYTAIKEGFKRMALERAGVGSKAELAASKLDWIDHMIELDFWFRMGSKIDRKATDSAQSALATRFRERDTIIDALDNILNDWAPEEDGVNGTLFWIVKTASDDIRKAETRFFMQLSDNWFLSADETSFLAFRSLLKSALSLAFVGRSGHVDFVSLGQNIRPVYDKLHSELAGMIRTIREILQSRLYEIDGESVSYQTASARIADSYRKTPDEGTVEDLPRRERFWKDLFKLAHRHADIPQQLSDFVDKEEGRICKELLSLVDPKYLDAVATDAQGRELLDQYVRARCHRCGIIAQ